MMTFFSRALAILLAVGVAVVASLAGVITGPSDRSAAAPVLWSASTTDDRAGQSAAWLIDQLDPDGTMPGPGGPQDWGLTIDVLFALHSVGAGQQAGESIVEVLEGNVGAYAGPAWWPDADTRLAGPTAKVLLVTVVAGEDHSDFGGRDMRAEALALLHDDPGSPEHGRVKDNIIGHPTTDNSNTFSQSLAVIGLARTGGVPREAVDFLLQQQCTEGYFRMFANDHSTNPGLTCDDGKAAGMSGADNDGTAMGLQALMSARDHGVSGLDEPIRRGLDYLVGAQRADGSFGGGVSTEGSNANSTALVAVALDAGGRSIAADAAQAYVRGLHLDPVAAEGTPMSGHVGAIAYNQQALESGLRDGIGAAGDQWRRSTAQAVLALDPTPLGDLGPGQLAPNPAPAPEPTEPSPLPSPTDPPVGPGPTPTDPPSTTPPAPTTPPAVTGTSSTDSSGPVPLPNRPAPGASTTAGPSARATGEARTGSGTRTEEDTDQETATSGPSTNQARQAVTYLLEALVDGTHLRTEVDGTAYVDHAETARAALALLAAEAPADRVQPVLDQLLAPQAVAEHAHGEPYDGPDAAYAEPLANLVLLATMSGEDPRDIHGSDLVSRLLDTQEDDGWFRDVSAQGDTTDTESQARAVLALRAAGEHDAAHLGAERLVAIQCADGLFPTTDPGAAGCASGDPLTTGLALQSLNARPPAAAAGTPRPATPTGPDAADAAKAEAVAGLLATQQDATWGERGSVAATGEAASGLIAVGVPAGTSVDWLTAQTTDEGGLSAVPGGPTDRAATISALPALAGSSYLTVPDGPLVSAGAVQPAGTFLASTTRDQGVETSSGSAAGDGTDLAEGLPWPWLLTLLLAAGAGALWWRSRGRSRRSAPAGGSSETASGDAR